MDDLDPQFFSTLQKWIVKKKLKGCSYENISKKYKTKEQYQYFNDSLSKDAIKTCLKRSSLSLQWIKGGCSGNLPLISEVDILALKEYAIENAIDGSFVDVEDIVEKANFLRKQRFQHATNFLTKCRCYSIIEELHKEQNIHDAGKTWVYSHLDELEADLNTPRNIELNRLISCTAENIVNYTDKLFPVLNSIEPVLRFCADETMLQPSVHQKVLIPRNMSRPLEPNELTIPHITAMCCCNVLGEKMPLFIVLPNLKRLPNDLKQIMDQGQAYFCSSQSGWQTRDTFLWLTICFLNWLSMFRLKLNKSIREKQAILIMDGHKSRENPIALKMLEQNNVTVFIIPAHTSHLTQLFDVGIASPMKNLFSSILKKLMNDFNVDENNLGQLRKFSIQAALMSWDAKANMQSCMKAAKVTGLCPCNNTDLLSSTFIVEITPQIAKFIEQRSKRTRNVDININCEFITSNEMLQKIDNYVSCSKIHTYL